MPALYSDRERQSRTGGSEPPPPRSVLDAIRDGIDVLKYLGGVAAAGLFYLDRTYELIPVSAQTRNWGLVAAIVAVVAGIGAHQSARRLREPSVGWGFFWFAVIDLLLLIGLVSVPLPSSVRVVASALPMMYALLFILLGGALGGFLL